MTAPLSHIYNLARLGQAGDAVRVEADQDQRAAIAQLAQIVSVERFVVEVTLSRTSPNRYVLDYRLAADVTQSCVVTLAPVMAALARPFRRELHFSGMAHRAAAEQGGELDLSGLPDEEPEEIENLHYDLAAPALEEFLLALDPYPRCPGVTFEAGEDAADPRESPFAVLKSLKSKT